MSSAAVAADENTQPGGGPEVVTELIITDVLVGDGATAEAGQSVIVHYTGWLYDPSKPDNKGSKFDSSVDRGQPFVFPLGAGRVIQGWDQGFGGMQIGGKRVLIIPSEMGYGERGAGADIPPNASLLFEVELLDIQ
jgi:FKBP-type peptidyl-prolyl cis-trans isomerase FkpA